MADEKEQKRDDKSKKKADNNWPLPNCTTAPSAEHFRAADEDEPCDDARATVIEEKKNEN